MLIVYDFEGGSPVAIKLSRWLTSDYNPNNASCEVNNSTVANGCWGDTRVLTTLGFADGAVNSGTVADALAPNNPPAQLGTVRFGEAGVNLTDAGVFSSDECTNFGNVYAVSRSSGNSAQAAMKDLVGPGDFTISNCGQLIVEKITDPSPDPTDTSFEFEVDGTNTPSLPKSFSLKNGESNSTVVFAGTDYSASETVPANWALVSATCEDQDGNATGTLSGSTVSDIAVAADDVVTCTFTNKLQQGAIKVTKTRKHAASGSGDHPHAGVNFTVDGVTKATDANGEACFDGLDFGNYTATETVPAGYMADGDTSKSVTVDNGATCDDDPYGGETVSFSNTPLTNLTVSVDSQVDGGTASTIVCKLGDTTVASGSTGANGDGSATANDLLPGVYTCTVDIDP